MILCQLDVVFQEWPQATGRHKGVRGQRELQSLLVCVMGWWKVFSTDFVQCNRNTHDCLSDPFRHTHAAAGVRRTCAT